MTAPTSNLSTTDLTHLVLLDLAQPASAAEIKMLVDRTFGKEIDISSIRLALDVLTHSGMVSCRVETAEERTLRCGGGTPTSRPARLYAVGKVVPARTVTELVPGVRLLSSTERRPRGKNKKRRRASGKAPRPAVTMPARPVTDTGTVTDTINQLVDRLVEQRTAELVQENRELKNRLAALRNLIS